MKNINLLLVMLSCLISNVIGQTLDNQWLILDNVGKSGYNSQTEANIYGNSNMGQRTKLWSIAHVEVDDPQVARNDIFVIFRDGNYFNSRDYNASSYKEEFFIPQASNEDSVNHYFYSINTSGIECLYLSDIYERDDPPDNVRATNWSGTISTTVDTFFNTIPVDVITANHTVAIEKDITLILKNSGSLTVNDTLYINKILVGSTLLYDEFFEVSNIFSGREDFSNISAEDFGNGKIVLKGFSTNNPPYIFINIRPSSALEEYAGSASAIFLLKHQNQSNPYASLTESVAYGYDPNYMQVKATCKMADGSQFINYHIEFENEGSVPAGDLKIFFTLPEYFYEDCITDSKFYIAGKEVKGSVFHNNKDVQFVFDPLEVVVPCTSPDIVPCSGYVEFWVRIDDEKDLTSLDTKLKLENARVIFDHKPFVINHFEDLPWIEDPVNPGRNSLRQSPNNLCTGFCRLEEDSLINELRRIKAYPNPGNEELYLSWNAKKAGNTVIYIQDLSGKKIYNNEILSQVGINKTNILANNLLPGFYIINVLSDGIMQSSLWIKVE